MSISTKKLRRDIRWTKDNESSVFSYPDNTGIVLLRNSYTKSPFTDEQCLAIDILGGNKSNSQKGKGWARMVIDSAIRNELKPRINKKLFRAYDTGKIDAITLLRKAGLVGGKL